MSKKQRGPSRPCRIFLCYRGNTASIANLVKSIMEKDRGHDYGNIWYSDQEGYGNFIQDIPYLIAEAEWIVFFVGETFTKDFLDEDKEINPDIVTAKELIEIEKERQKRQAEGRILRLLSVNIDGHSFDAACAKDLDHLFRNAGILKSDSVDAYRGLNRIPYASRTTDPFDFVENSLAPYCAKPSDAGTPRPNDNSPESDAGRKQPKKAAQPEAELLEEVEDIDAVEADSPAAFRRAKRGATNPSPILLANGNILFGHYPQTENGDVVPIEWLVLKREGSKALLLSKYALDVRQYNDTYTDTTWEECSLQRWLNGERKDSFLHAAFTRYERSLIRRTTFHTEQNPTRGTDARRDVKSNVFLLSVEEARQLFPSEEARRCAPTAYVESRVHTNDKYLTEGRASCRWWLRSPGHASCHTACIISGGSVYDPGFFFLTQLGIRPALWINISIQILPIWNLPTP